MLHKVILKACNDPVDVIECGVKNDDMVYSLNLGKLYFLFDETSTETDPTKRKDAIIEPFVVEYKEDNEPTKSLINKSHIIEHLIENYNLDSDTSNKIQIEISEEDLNNINKLLSKVNSSILNTSGLIRHYLDLVYKPPTTRGQKCKLFKRDSKGNIHINLKTRDESILIKKLYPESIELNITEFLILDDLVYGIKYDIDEERFNAKLKEFLLSIIRREFYSTRFNIDGGGYSKLITYNKPILINLREIKDRDSVSYNPIYFYITEESPKKMMIKFNKNLDKMRRDIFTEDSNNHTGCHEFTEEFTQTWLKDVLPTDIFELLEAINNYLVIFNDNPIAKYIGGSHERFKLLHKYLLSHDISSRSDDYFMDLRIRIGLFNNSPNIIFGTKYFVMGHSEDELINEMALATGFHYSNGIVINTTHNKILPTINPEIHWVYDLLKELTGTFTYLTNALNKYGNQ